MSGPVIPIKTVLEIIDGLDKALTLGGRLFSLAKQHPLLVRIPVTDEGAVMDDARSAAIARSRKTEIREMFPLQDEPPDSADSSDETIDTIVPGDDDDTQT